MFTWKTEDVYLEIVDCFNKLSNLNIFANNRFDFYNNILEPACKKVGIHTMAPTTFYRWLSNDPKYETQQKAIIRNRIRTETKFQRSFISQQVIKFLKINHNKYPDNVQEKIFELWDRLINEIQWTCQTKSTYNLIVDDKKLPIIDIPKIQKTEVPPKQQNTKKSQKKNNIEISSEQQNTEVTQEIKTVEEVKKVEENTNIPIIDQTSFFGSNSVKPIEQPKIDSKKENSDDDLIDDDDNNKKLTDDPLDLFNLNLKRLNNVYNNEPIQQNDIQQEHIQVVSKESENLIQIKQKLNNLLNKSRHNPVVQLAEHFAFTENKLFQYIFITKLLLFSKSEIITNLCKDSKQLEKLYNLIISELNNNVNVN